MAHPVPIIKAKPVITIKTILLAIFMSCSFLVRKTLSDDIYNLILFTPEAGKPAVDYYAEPFFNGLRKTFTPHNNALNPAPDTPDGQRGEGL